MHMLLHTAKPTNCMAWFPHSVAAEPPSLHGTTPPADAFHVEAAAQKNMYPFPKLMVLGLLAGAHLSLSGLPFIAWNNRLGLHGPTSCCTRSVPSNPVVSCSPIRSIAPAGAYISLGYSLCSLVGGQLSKEFRLEQPGAFNFLFGIFGALGEGSGPRTSSLARVCLHLLCLLPPSRPPNKLSAHMVLVCNSRPAGFPMGLTLCVVAGADLFTSNCMYATIAVAEGETSVVVCGPAPPRFCSFRPPRQPCSAGCARCAAGRYGLLGMLRCWLVSYFCNLLGSLLMVR